MPVHSRTAPPVVSLALLVALAGPAGAELLPHSGPRELTERADLVVRGRWLGGGRVEVVTWFLRPAGLPEGTRVLRVAGMTEPTRAERDGARRGARGVTRPARGDLVLFAERDTDTEAWRPLATRGPGAQGVWWLDGGRVLHYEQAINPGPYVLREWEPSGGGDAVEALTAAVRTGLAARLRLGQAAATPRDADARSPLVEYLLLPCADRLDTFHTQAVAARELRGTPEPHAPLLERLPELADSRAITRVLGVLARLGEYDGPASRHLLDLLEGPRGVPLREVLAAVRGMRVAGARGAVARILADGSLEDASFAATTLVALGDPSVQARLVDRLRAAPASRDEAPWLGRLVGVLDTLDHTAAVEFATRWKDDPRFSRHYRDAFRRIVEARPKDATQGSGDD